MEASREPSQQTVFLVGQINTGDSNGSKAQFGAPTLDLFV